LTARAGTTLRAFAATEVASGFQWLVAGWEAPPGRDRGWEVPEPDVHGAVDEAFRRWQVWRLYGDPFFWESQLAAWSGTYGADRVVEWRTNRWAQIAYAVRGFASAIQAGEVSHDGDADLARHIGNAHKHLLNFRDDQGERLWVIQKERPDSPFKIDYAMAAILSWQARTDAIASGEATSEPIKIEFW